jgi:hypothetical protein
MKVPGGLKESSAVSSRSRQSNEDEDDDDEFEDPSLRVRQLLGRAYTCSLFSST